jgi:hypothetical protein
MPTKASQTPSWPFRKRIPYQTDRPPEKPKSDSSSPLSPKLRQFRPQAPSDVFAAAFATHFRRYKRAGVLKHPTRPEADYSPQQQQLRQYEHHFPVFASISGFRQAGDCQSYFVQTTIRLSLFPYETQDQLHDVGCRSKWLRKTSDDGNS